MKLIRFLSDDNQEQTAWVMDNKIGIVEGDIYSEFRRMEPRILLEKVKLLPPIRPGKIICVARNYEEHAREQQVDLPEMPMLFLKPPSSIIGLGDKIIIPPQSKQVEHEAELAVVIRKSGKWIKPEEVSQYILGYTIANDITARDIQHKEGHWTRAKGFDTFCPIGPWIETEFDPSDRLVTCRVDGELRQMASTKDFLFSVPQIISFISSVMTLEPGDLILTGTPAGVGPLEKGQEVEVEIEGIGILTNQVAEPFS